MNTALQENAPLSLFPDVTGSANGHKSSAFLEVVSDFPHMSDTLESNVRQAIVDAEIKALGGVLSEGGQYTLFDSLDAVESVRVPLAIAVLVRNQVNELFESRGVKISIEGDKFKIGVQSGAINSKGGDLD